LSDEIAASIRDRWDNQSHNGLTYEEYYSPPVCEERRRRILVCLWAYAYEIQSQVFVSDERFDSECLLVDVSVNTGHPVMDSWFKKEFDPCTGSWVHTHPEIEKLSALYHRTKSRTLKPS